MRHRTRLVLVSDTHNSSPSTGAFKLPAGDVLIHAGDLTKQGTYAELHKALSWLSAAPYEAVIVVAGNHDITLDSAFYSEHGAYWHNKDPQSSAQCRGLFSEFPNIIYLEHECADVKLNSPNGPKTKFRVFGSPHSPRKRQWAFQYSPEEAEALWAQIPLDADVVVTHTPPKFHRDEWEGREGCEALRQALWRVRPRLHVCGHVHNGRGAERIRWDLGNPNVRFKEMNVGYWEDESIGTKKQSLLDLSQRRGEALLNDGGHPGREDRLEDMDVDMADAEKVVEADSSADGSGGKHPATVVRIPLPARGQMEATEISATRGQGGLPPSGRSDVEALVGRLGRQETCVVNASIMTSAWPYKGGAQRYNKPIVVDIDLPVWE